jgi:hypothetical protein
VKTPFFSKIYFVFRQERREAIKKPAFLKTDILKKAGSNMMNPTIGFNRIGMWSVGFS